MRDEIYVINVGVYVGESTKSEIGYAKIKNKKSSYLDNIKKYRTINYEGEKK